MTYIVSSGALNSTHSLTVMKLKQNSFKTVLFQFHVVVQTILVYHFVVFGDNVTKNSCHIPLIAWCEMLQITPVAS